LELALVSGELTVCDLPAAWNEKMRTLLGITPQNDREGVLQDVHWSIGAFGYFPTYTLAASIRRSWPKPMHASTRCGTRFAAAISAGCWAGCATNIHTSGHRYSAEETVAHATGKGLDPEAFFRHLESKLES
jgi:carboxypeptidase Taq